MLQALLKERQQFKDSGYQPQSCRFVCLLLCSWPEAQGAAQKLSLWVFAREDKTSCRTTPLSQRSRAPGESCIPFPPFVMGCSLCCSHIAPLGCLMLPLGWQGATKHSGAPRVENVVLVPRFMLLVNFSLDMLCSGFIITVDLQTCLCLAEIFKTLRGTE